jgi:hypothetical protein
MTVVGVAASMFLAAVSVAMAHPALGEPPPDDDSGQITVTPGDSLGWNNPPRVRMDAEYGKRSTRSGDRSTGYLGTGAGSAGSTGTSAKSGSSSGPTCTVERPSGGGFAQPSSSPEEMRKYFPDLYMGSRGGDESKVYITRCSDGSTGWVTGDGADAGGGGGRPVVVLPTPAELAERARQQLKLPLPAPGMSPKVRLDDGRDATLVRENTWLWVDHGDWSAQSERVQVGPVWAEVTARPKELRVETTTGESLRCDGPGTPYRRSYGMHAASPDCGLRFERAAEETTGEFQIVWSVSWKGSTGASDEGGELPTMISRASETFTVAEAQSLRAR